MAYIDPIQGRRVRLPVPLLSSRHHSPLAVGAYAVLDVLGGPDRGPVTARREWLAARLGASLGGLKKALAALATAHADDLSAGVPGCPVLLVSRPRGSQLTAEREVLPGIPKVDVPEWTLGDDRRGPLVSWLAWRAYVVYLAKRSPYSPACELPRAEVAKLLRVRADSMPKLVRELEAAGLVVSLSMPGLGVAVAPQTKGPAVGAWRDVAVRQLRAACGYVDNPTPLRGRSTGSPHPSAGPYPHPSAGPSPHPSMGPSIKDPSSKTLLLDPAAPPPAPDGAGGRLDGCARCAARVTAAAARGLPPARCREHAEVAA